MVVKRFQYLARIGRSLLGAAITLLAVALANAADVSVTRLNGSSFTGTLTQWSNTGVEIATANGPQTVPFDQLLALRWLPAPIVSAQDATLPAVELIDGSLLPIADYRVAGARATATFADGAGPPDQRELSLAVRQVAAVRLQSLSASVTPQWNEIREQNLPSDVLVLIKRGGESLDYAEVVLGDVAADKIEFKLEDETTRADRALLAGVIYYRRAALHANDPRCIVHGRGGLRAVVAQATAEGEMLHMKTVSGAELVWPLADVHLADFSAGKIVYLSDLSPASERWTPLVAMPATASAAAAYGRLRRDRSPFGHPIVLWFPEDASLGGRGHERSFDKGLAMRSRTDLIYRLPNGYSRLVAFAGIDPTTSASGNVALSIQGDDRPLFEAEIAGNRAPVAIDIDITGVRRLSIIVDYGRNLDSGDWLILGDARIVK